LNIKACVAEFVGVFALCFIGIGAIAADNMSGGGLGLTGIALAHGLAIACLASATAGISGGHLNPAVTIGLLTAKKIDVPNAIGYIIAQVLAGFAAAALVGMCLPDGIMTAISGGSPAPNAGMNVTSTMALVAEIVTTFFLVFVVYGTAVDKRAPKMGALFIGLTVVMGIMMAGPISGGALNPARFTGPGIMAGVGGHMWIYWVGPCLGGVIAAQVWKQFLEEKD